MAVSKKTAVALAKADGKKRKAPAKKKAEVKETPVPVKVVTVKEEAEVTQITPRQISDLIEVGLEHAVENKGNSLSRDDIPSVKTSLMNTISPVVVNATNQEPWYKSRVVIGTLISLLSVGARYAGIQFDYIDQETMTDLVLQLVPVLGGFYALYGRLKTGLKPIGE